MDISAERNRMQSRLIYMDTTPYEVATEAFSFSTLVLHLVDNISVKLSNCVHDLER